MVTLSVLVGLSTATHLEHGPVQDQSKVVGSRVHHSEIDLLEEIFGVNTAAYCKNIEYSKLQLCEILFAVSGYVQSWKCPKFSICGYTLYHERSNSFLL